jgi:hypothetical protein
MTPLPVIRSQKQADEHDQNEPALVEIPGEMVRSIVWMVETLQMPGYHETAKTLRSLLKKKIPRKV